MRILWPENVAADIISHFRHTLETGETYYSPRFTNPRHDIEVVESYEWELHRVTLPDGHFGVVCYYYDSTKLRDAEMALRESEQRYRGLFENIQELVTLYEVVRNEQGEIIERRLVDCNPAFLKAVNAKSLDEIKGKTWGELFKDDDPTRNLPEIRRAMSSGKPIVFESSRRDVAQNFLSTITPLGSDTYLVTGRDITERKRAEEALRRIREDLDRAQEVGQVGSWRLDIQQNRLTWSDETHRIFGIPRGNTITYETFIGAVHPDDRSYVDMKWQAALRGEGYDLEHRIVVDGAPRWVHEKAYLEFDGAGKLLGGFGIVQDITEKKYAEEELTRVNKELATRNERLQKSEEELQSYSASLKEMVETRTRDLRESTEVLRSFMDSASEGLSIWDSELRLLGANDAWMRRWPETMIKENLIGKKMTELYPGVENTERYQKYLDILRTGEPFHYEGQLAGDKVKKRHFSSSVFRVGTGLGIISTDITEEHRLNEELRTSRERLEAFMESSTEGFSLYDKDLNLIQINGVVLSRYPAGTRREDIIGRNIRDLYPGVEDTKWYTSYLKLLETGEPFHFDAEPGVAQTGALLLETSAFKVGDGIGVITRDVTREVELEARLREAQRGEAIDKVSAMVAHDIRSPLNTAYQALEMAKLKPEQGETLTAMAERNVMRAIEMIEDLRENTRLIETRRQNVSLTALLDDTIREKHLPEGVTAAAEYGEGLDRVSLDPSLIRRVVENLLSNAAEAMPHGGRVKVTAYREGGEVTLSVADSGTGIPPEIAAKIFNPLFTTKAKGVGLGLSYCKRAVEAHGGAISFTSTPGEGTTFTIRVPQPPG